MSRKTQGMATQRKATKKAATPPKTERKASPKKATAPARTPTAKKAPVKVAAKATSRPATKRASTPATTPKAHPVKLTEMQQRFVDEYLIDLNGTQAAIRAGYSAHTAAEQAYDLLRRPHIQAAIAAGRKKQQERTEITADRVLRELARLAFFDPRKFFDRDGAPINIQDLDDDTAAALAGMDVMEVFEGSGKDREFVGYLKKFKLPDKGAQLDRLMKHLGLYKEDNEQKTDPLTSLLAAITGGNSSTFKPVARDPEHSAGSTMPIARPGVDPDDEPD